MYTVRKVSLIVFFCDFSKQYGIADVFDCMNLHSRFIATCSQSSNSSLVWLKERAGRSWLIQHETSATWLIPDSNCPWQKLKLGLLKELFRPNTWPITKWPFITLTLRLESCQFLSHYSATVLSVSSQDTLSSMSTLPWLCLPQRYTNAACRRLY